MGQKYGAKVKFFAIGYGGYRGMEPSKVHSWEILQNPWNVLDHCIECICASWTLFPQTNITSFQLISFFSSKTILLPPVSSSIIHCLTFEKVFPLQHFYLINLHRQIWWQYKTLSRLEGWSNFERMWWKCFCVGHYCFWMRFLSSGSGKFLVLFNLVRDNHQAWFLDQTTIGLNIFDYCPHLVKLCRGNLL